jgi:serine/threonine protein kinase
LTIEQALFYLDQVCNGLQHAHERGVIHRDIKPQNLLFTADRQTVKIADFGVAKIEAGDDGSITRVGTDVYAAPEHHPLLQTGPLDPGAADQTTRRLTPAADVYSLAKTAYTMLTGEAPRRFSQKPITDLPEQIAAKTWASHALRVLRRATETFPSKRYQTVREFWDELSDALMPKTQLLSQLPVSEETRPLSQIVGARERVELPPEPMPAKFEPPTVRARENAQTSAQRPRIVVPVALAQQPTPTPQVTPPQATRARAGQSSMRVHEPEKPAQVRDAKPARRRNETESEPLARGSFFKDHARRWIVVLLLLTGFALLLLGIYASVRHSPRATSSTPVAGAQGGGSSATNESGLKVGNELTATTNVNLREGPNRNTARVGEIETGSRVRIRQVIGNWVEVDVLSRGTPHVDDEGADRGWLDGTKLR